ncbi:MAG TPA: TolC family protein [Bryobacteraceae bacterium]|nr:TolC family protein [Bryobacteraceae bacterium]
MSKETMIKTFTIGILLTTGAFAQMSYFPRPNYFRETFKNVNTRVELQPPSRLKDFVKDGKLELSLRDYLGLVMANNTGIQIQYLTLERSRNSITSAYGAWDPTATFGIRPQSSTFDPKPNTPVADPSYGGSTTRTWPLTFGFNQTLETGQSISASASGTKTSADGGYPGFSTGLGLSITQPLLRNRGAYVNKIPLFEAQSSYKQAGFNLTSTLLSLISNAENVYWNAVSARESVKVNKTALDAAQSNWDFIQEQFKLGAISYLDTYNPQEALASAQLAYRQSVYNEQAAEDQARNQLAADLDPDIRKLPLSLTEPVDLPESETVVPDKEAEVQKALGLQPSLKAANQSLDIDDLSIASAENGLKPTLNLSLGYSGAGAGGYYTNGFYSPAIIPGGLGDALGQVFGLGSPTYYANLTLTLPLRNRSASVVLANSLIQKRNDTLTVRNTQQTIRLNILNAVVNLQNAIESVSLAKTQDDFSNLNLQAEVTKYKLGNEIQQNVVFAQQQLAQSDLTLLNAKITLQKAVLSLYTQTGELLDKRGIIVKTP